MLRERLTRPLRAVRRRVLIHRRGLAALLAAVAVASGVHAVTAPPPASVPVEVAARDLPAGTRLTEGDLTVREFAPGSVPAGVVGRPAGQVLAGPLRSGEPVTDARLVGPALTAADPARVAVPVRLPDAGTVALLEVGDRIDLLATDPQAGGAEVVAAGVPVLALPPAGAASGPVAGPVTATGQPGALVVVGAEPADVTSLADAGVRRFLSYAFAR